MYAAWIYYKRLPAAVAKLIESPNDLKGEDDNNIYEVILRKAKEVDERLRQTGELIEQPLTVAAAITTPPVLQLSWPKRNRQEGSDSEGRSRKVRRSSSRERNRTPGRGRRGSYKGYSREGNHSNSRGRDDSQTRGILRNKEFSSYVSATSPLFLL